jgi:predicted metal-dependent HD superfamily phosphohydrolase
MAATPDEQVDAAWYASLGGYGVPVDAATRLLTSIRERHREPHRRYHTLDHVAEVLRAVDALADLADHPARVRLAACYHDAVYDPRSSGNEEASARLAVDQLTEVGVPPDVVDGVADLVRMTADHRTRRDPDAEVLADADLWILGAPPARYRRYTADVRAEYAHADDDAWRTGRTAVLDSFLARRRLYATDRFHAELDATARANLARERATLRPA